MKLKGLAAVLTLCVILSGCGEISSEYIEELKTNGASDEQIRELIKYERKNKNLPDGGYVDVTGRCVGEVAEDLGIKLEEYLELNGLPSDMPYLVSETEANYTIPAAMVAPMYGMDFKGLAKLYDFPDNVNEDTPWGVAVGETTVGAYVGEENVEKFKQDYGLDGSVTSDTKWKEVREVVDRAKRDRREKGE